MLYDDGAGIRNRGDVLPPHTYWTRAEWFFHSIQLGSVDEVVSAYAPNAALQNPILGQVNGDDLAQFWTTFLRRTPRQKLDFTITSVMDRKVSVEWRVEYEFFDTGRTIKLPGMSELTFEGDRIALHLDWFDWRRWSHQALGLSGLMLSYLPGAKSFLRGEARRVFGLSAQSDEGDARGLLSVSRRHKAS